ncbi:MAG TPA: energy transducer TonB [Gammaproteobacteria bacterium]
MAVNYENLPGAGSAPRGLDNPNVRDLRIPGPLDATLPPTPIRELLAASGATVYVLATDSNFVATIRRAAEQHPLFVVESWPELLEAVQSGQCGIALLDATALGGRVAHCVATLAGYHDRLVTLVAADRAAAHEYVGLLSGGRIHRLLIKPTAVGAARLLIESATARRLQLREESTNAVAAATPAATRFPQGGWIAAAGVGAVALLGLALVGARLDWWDLAGARQAAEPAAVVAAPPASPTPADLLAEHRAKAVVAFQEGRFAEPLGESALDHYLAVLALVPGDQSARDGVASVLNVLFSHAEQALLTNSLETAAATLDQVRRADPASSRLAFLDAQLTRALAALPVVPPAPAKTAPPPVVTAPAAPTELESMLSLAAARLARGQVVTPAGDSAVAYLDRATLVGRNDPRVAALRLDVSAALLAGARLALDTDVAAAANLTAEARRLGPDSAALVALEADVAAALARERQRQLSERLASAHARVQSGALFEPANASALYYLTGLQTDAPEFAGLGEEWEAFRQAAVLAIESSIEKSEWQSADAQLAALAQAPGGAIAAQPLAAELAARRLQQTYLATAAQASVMTLQTSARPVYPPELLSRGVEGWVDLEFVVDRTGTPRDIVVKQGSPPARFDEAAVAAVQQYRYVPFERDGRVYERRLKLRMRFQVQ